MTSSAPTNPSRARCGAPVKASALAAVENPAPGSDTWLAPTPTAAAVVEPAVTAETVMNLLLRQGVCRYGHVVRERATCDPPTTALLIRSPTPMSETGFRCSGSHALLYSQCTGVTNVAATAESNDFSPRVAKSDLRFYWETAAVSAR